MAVTAVQQVVSVNMVYHKHAKQDINVPLKTYTNLKCVMQVYFQKLEKIHVIDEW